MVKEIILSKGKICLVDDEDFEELNKHKWYVSKSGYAVRNVRNENGRGILYIHRIIMNANKGISVDHINHNPLDNRKCNLRLCSHQQNMMNRNMDNKKGYIFDKKSNKWKVYITINYKQIYIGLFNIEAEAKEARRLAEIKYFGEYAYNPSNN